MSNRVKNAIYSIVLIALMYAVYLYRQNNAIESPLSPEIVSSLGSKMHLKGITMGVIEYNVKYLNPSKISYQKEVDQLLKDFNQSLSTYIPSSEISRFNKEENFTFESNFFYPVLQRSKDIFKETEGAFDPTVMPLVNAWGFGPNKAELKEEIEVSELLELIGFNKLTFDKKGIKKNQIGIQLDFSAIAKGYAVDVVAEYLESQGVSNYMVEIGREVRCKGVNEQGNTWLIGIINPYYKEKGGELMSAKVKLQNRALATSGNYENYYVMNEKKYAHTIDPRTGYPVQHSLLSASVFANDCMTADAFATALMVVGPEKAQQIIEQNSDLEGILIYDEKGELKIYASTAIKKFMID